MTTTHPRCGTRRLKAAIIGVGLDASADDPRRIITGKECLVVGGSEGTHAEMLETMLRLEAELDRLGRRLADLPPEELAEVAWRIDSPELGEIALRMESALEARGVSFEMSSAEDLNALVNEGL